MAALAWILVAGVAWGSGPRYVTGPPYFTGPAGVPVGWRQTQLLYFTDPGDLSPTVNHAAADALVAAAAGVWNVSVANITVSQGGELGEHVSGANVYLSNTGMVWPTDVMSTNAAAIPVSVVYDADGSVTDALLGGGASSPSSCRQNAVTESVDSFDPAGYISHAIVVVNGRCTGAAPEQQLQLQYELERVIGRILGLAWSQNNDNVFSGVPTPTYDQAAHWPIMHPIDVLCGPYSYQCLPTPFQLREDDVAGLVGLYPIKTGTVPGVGKELSLTNANSGWSFVYFSDGDGMTGVNLLVSQEPRFSTAENEWYTVSGVTGAYFRRNGKSPFISVDLGVLGSMGATGANWRGYVTFPYIPMMGGQYLTSQDEFLSFEPVNPLYIGAQSLGPYSLGVAAPAGGFEENFPLGPVGIGQNPGDNFTASGGPSACASGADGTLSMPTAVQTSGWWQGLVCGYGHASYGWLAVKSGRSLTVEVTGLDGNGFPTTTKAMPVIGLFSASDGTTSLPSLGVQESAFNGLGIGTTQLRTTPFAAGGAGGIVRVGIADERGEGRPDFLYQARVFYADTVSPGVISSSGSGSGSGATLTIVGMGFRAGNRVSVNGVAATVTSWTSNTIVATAPTMAGAGATAGAAVDVEVLDVGTGATSTVSGALTYSGGALGNAMVLVSAPLSPAFTGSAATPTFAIRMMKADGVTPLAGEAVVFSAASGTVTFSACGAAICSLTTDAGGNVASGVIPQVAGSITVQAVDGSVGVSATFVAQVHGASMVVKLAPSGSVAVGTTSPPQFQVAVQTAGGLGLSGQLITFRVTQGSAVFRACNAAVCSTLTNAQGIATVLVVPTGGGPVTLQASDGDLNQTVSFVATTIPNQLTWIVTAGATQYVGGKWHLVARLTAGDGVTSIQGFPLVFSGPAGVNFEPCSGNPCTFLTDQEGKSDLYGSSSEAGNETLSVTDGVSTITTTFQVVQPVPTLKFVVVPSANVAVGTAAQFTAQILDQWGNPMGGQVLTLGAPLGQAILSPCGSGSCYFPTDGNGEATSTVTPLQAGTILVEAVWQQMVVQSSFTAVGGRETLTIVTPPPATANVGIAVTMKVLAMAADGVTPKSGVDAWANVTSGNVSLSGCGYALCKYNLASDGTLTLTGVSWVPGLTTVTVTVDGLTVTMSYTVVSPTSSMVLVSAPSGNYPAGLAITPNFVVQVLGPDGKTGLSGQNVTFSVANGSATLGVCASLACAVKTNSTGVASSGSIGVVGPGAVTLLAADNGMTRTASYTVLPKPDLVSVASSPPTVYQGATTLQAFGVQVMLADGVTPAAGVTVTLHATGGTGAATYSACGAASCSLVTNANGLASSAVTGTQAGTLTLSGTATLATGNQTVSAPLMVLANVRTVSGTPLTTYVAEATILSENIALSAVQNGAVAPGQGVVWTGIAGYSIGATNGTTDGTGSANVSATIGPLAGGASAQATGCMWQTVCVTYEAHGVSASVWAVAVASGGNQTVSGGATLAGVVARVTDAVGHPVAGAQVSVGQTVRAFDAPCPVEGRCPAAPVLATGSVTLTTDGNGEVTVVPLVVSGMATQTSLAFSAGLQGFATAVVSSKP